MKENLIYFFSSAPKDRPEYIRGILDGLCYPSGHQLELSYKRKHINEDLLRQIDEDLRKSLNPLDNRCALFVFADYKTPDIEFLAVRYAKITRVCSKQTAAKFDESSRLFFRILLGDLVDYNDTTSLSIRAIAGRPVHHDFNPRAKYYYVLEHENVCALHHVYGLRDRWERLALEAGRADSLADCIFLQTGPLIDFKTDAECALSSYGGHGDQAYTLRPNSIYKAEVRIYYPSARPSGQEIFIRSSSDLLVVSQAFPTAIGGTSDHEALVTCKRSIEDTLAALVFDVRPRDTTQAASSTVICAKPQYLVSISVPKALLWQFIAFVFVGVLLSSMSPDFFKEWGASLDPWRKSLGLLAKILGAACLARAAYIGFRKLPSGGPAT